MTPNLGETSIYQIQTTCSPTDSGTHTRTRQTDRKSASHYRRESCFALLVPTGHYKVIEAIMDDCQCRFSHLILSPSHSLVSTWVEHPTIDRKEFIRRQMPCARMTPAEKWMLEILHENRLPYKSTDTLSEQNLLQVHCRPTSSIQTDPL